MLWAAKRGANTEQCKKKKSKAKPRFHSHKTLYTNEPVSKLVVLLISDNLDNQTALKVKSVIRLMIRLWKIQGTKFC